MPKFLAGVEIEVTADHEDAAIAGLNSALDNMENMPGVPAITTNVMNFHLTRLAEKPIAPGEDRQGVPAEVQVTPKESGKDQKR